MIGGESLSLFQKCKTSDQYELNEETLKHVFNQKIPLDLPVCIIAFVGPSRKGKSFLMNYILRYLYSDKSEEDWITCKGDDQPLEGFEWSQNFSPETQGIRIWSEIFAVDLDDNINRVRQTLSFSAHKMALILIDTEGTFSACQGRSMQDCSSIFGFASLLSSVLVYNISNNITQNDLDHLYFFTHFNDLIIQSAETELKEKKKERKHKFRKAFTNLDYELELPPLQRLIFLIRDWNFPYELPFGPAGGQEHLKMWFDDYCEKCKDQQVVRQDLQKVFENVSCYLMPHPGFQLISDKNYKGETKFLDIDFRQHVKNFVVWLISAKNMSPKKVNGQIITLGDVPDILRIFLSSVRKYKDQDTVPFKYLITKVSCQMAFTNSLKVYNTMMWRFIQKDDTLRTFEKAHCDAYSEALKYYEETNKFGKTSKTLYDQYREKLVDGIKKDKIRFKQKQKISMFTRLWRYVKIPLVIFIVIFAFFISFISYIIATKLF